VPDLCRAYNWPTGLTGGGIIAIVELGGGWVQPDMDEFFRGINQPVPSITDVSVDGPQNTPDPSPDSADGEVALDIEVAAAAYYAATGKPATIRVYWAQDIASAVRAATADNCDVCSISWGADETIWGAQAGQDMEQAAIEATTAGMIVFAASGDNDSSDGGPGRANLDLPASAPHVIGCGGTSKTRTQETVWNNNPGNADGEGTGGGFSTLFRPMPPWQAGAPHGPGRMVPDIAADADPITGYNIVLHGAGHDRRDQRRRSALCWAVRLVWHQTRLYRPGIVAQPPLLQRHHPRRLRITAARSERRRVHNSFAFQTSD